MKTILLVTAMTTAVIGGFTTAKAQSTTGDAVVTKTQFRGEREGRRGMRGNLEEVFRAVDANDDGAITQNEVDAYRSGVVAQADASGDGSLSMEEFETVWLSQMRGRMEDAFARLDTDGDGIITQTEMDARLGDIVERMDRNGDGQLDRADRRGKRRG